MISVYDRGGGSFSERVGTGSGTVAGVLGLLITLLGFAGVMVLAQPRPERVTRISGISPDSITEFPQF